MPSEGGISSSYLTEICPVLPFALSTSYHCSLKHFVPTPAKAKDVLRQAREEGFYFHNQFRAHQSLGPFTSIFPPTSPIPTTPFSSQPAFPLAAGCPARGSAPSQAGEFQRCRAQPWLWPAGGRKEPPWLSAAPCPARFPHAQPSYPQGEPVRLPAPCSGKPLGCTGPEGEQPAGKAGGGSQNPRPKYLGRFGEEVWNEHPNTGPGCAAALSCVPSLVGRAGLRARTLCSPHRARIPPTRRKGWVWHIHPPKGTAEGREGQPGAEPCTLPVCPGAPLTPYGSGTELVEEHACGAGRVCAGMCRSHRTPSAATGSLHPWEPPHIAPWMWGGRERRFGGAAFSACPHAACPHPAADPRRAQAPALPQHAGASPPPAGTEKVSKCPHPGRSRPPASSSHRPFHRSTFPRKHRKGSFRVSIRMGRKTLMRMTRAACEWPAGTQRQQHRGRTP